MKTTTSRAISALLLIVRDADQAPVRRLEACEHVLDYEAPPEIVDETKGVIMTIVEATETSVDLRLAALKLLRRVEARRVSPGRAVREVNIELSRAAEIARRRGALLKAGIFPYPDGYADDLYAEDYQPLPDDPKPAADIAVALRNARLAHSASVLIQKTLPRNAGKNRVKSRAQKSVLSHTQNS